MEVVLNNYSAFILNVLLPLISNELTFNSKLIPVLHFFLCGYNIIKHRKETS